MSGSYEVSPITIQCGYYSDQDAMKYLTDALKVEGDEMDLPDNFSDAIVKVYAKYRVDPTMPVMVGGKIIGDSYLRSCSVSNKAIKF